MCIKFPITITLQGNGTIVSRNTICTNAHTYTAYTWPFQHLTRSFSLIFNLSLFLSSIYLPLSLPFLLPYIHIYAKLCRSMQTHTFAWNHTCPRRFIQAHTGTQVLVYSKNYRNCSLYKGMGVQMYCIGQFWGCCYHCCCPYPRILLFCSNDDCQWDSLSYYYLKKSKEHKDGYVVLC